MFASITKSSNGEMIVGGICRDNDCFLPEHEHPEAQLTIFFSGNVPTLLTHGEAGNTQRNDLRSDSFIFLPPDQSHRLNWNDYGEVLHLFMPHEDLLKLSEASRCPMPNIQLGDHPDRGIFEIGRLIVDEFDATGGLTPTMLDHATSLMMARMLRVTERLSRESSTSVLSVQRLQPAINILNDCPEKEFTLAELASLCNSSVFHFARFFQRPRGMCSIRLSATAATQEGAATPSGH